MRNVMVFGALAVAAAVWTGVSAQQEMLPRPGPGSGVTPIRGTVSIETLPDLEVKQRGDWRVGITDLPAIQIAPAPFLRRGGRYEITWPNGDQETVTVRATGADGWVQVGQKDGPWLNLRNARAVRPAD